ncbi:uncharacterized protein EDB93DRAFT_1165468 [Suillus bovinus]|uniref:uncharacterized protein n=1 Tax=Suillus bovinus TaxID=48563 RepID=UPI001B87EC84|nr:uncharacterized protein EDB93DRAFT_1165468 [Suillus bovinus]KAG2138412.1 hypothetical protein EDB93DRAFT_1165468 [Suillus bovinus]
MLRPSHTIASHFFASKGRNTRCRKNNRTRSPHHTRWFKRREKNGWSYHDTHTIDSFQQSKSTSQIIHSRYSYLRNYHKMPAARRNTLTAQCSVCQRVISRKADLPRHMRTHAENKDELMHACLYDGCDYKTLQWSNLQTHIRTHTGERWKKCPECPFSTTDPGSLTRHRKSEHGYKPKARRARDDGKATRRGAAAPYPSIRFVEPEVSCPGVRSRLPSPKTPNTQGSSRQSPSTNSSPISLRPSSPYVVSPLSSPCPPRTPSNLRPSPPISPLSPSNRSYSLPPRTRSTFTMPDFSFSPSPSPEPM